MTPTIFAVVSALKSFATPTHVVEHLGAVPVQATIQDIALTTLLWGLPQPISTPFHIDWSEGTLEAQVHCPDDGVLCIAWHL